MVLCLLWVEIPYSIWIVVVLGNCNSWHISVFWLLKMACIKDGIELQYWFLNHSVIVSFVLPQADNNSVW